MTSQELIPQGRTHRRHEVPVKQEKNRNKGKGEKNKRTKRERETVGRDWKSDQEFSDTTNRSDQNTSLAVAMKENRHNVFLSKYLLP